MKHMKYLKKIYIALFVLIAFGLIVSVVETTPAYAKSGHHGSRPPGGHKDNNHYAKMSKTGKCEKIHGYCVTFSTGGCGNYYINGWHYSGKTACEVLGVCKKHTPNYGGGGGNNVTFTGTKHTVTTHTTIASSTSGTTTVTSVLTRSCTPGTGINACPPDDLGVIMTNFFLNPSYANSKTKTCPLFWTPGKEDATSKIVCKLETNGIEVDVPKDPKTEGYANGFPIAPGKHTLTCKREIVKTVTDASGIHDDVSSTEQSAQFNCRAYPEIKEI